VRHWEVVEKESPTTDIRAVFFYIAVGGSQRRKNVNGICGLDLEKELYG
jgi:hypothetical protein